MASETYAAAYCLRLCNDNHQGSVTDTSIRQCMR